MRKFNQLPNDMKRHLKAVERTINRDLPRIIGIEGQRFFEQSWQRQGWMDRSLSKWKARKPPKKFRKDGKPLKSYTKWKAKNQGRAILVGHRSDTKGGHLKDSLVKHAGRNLVRWTSDKPYARVHNEGLKAGRGKGFKMPRRQFIGNSAELRKRIRAKLDRQIMKALSN